jgi:CBS domain-containing protein
MEVREGMSALVLTIGPGITLREAARMMTEKEVGAAVVLDEESPGPGIISERDVLISIGRGQDPDQECVGDHMSASVITASPDWSLERAASEMASRGIRHLVIVDGGELAGVLSMRDIMRVWTSDGATSAMTPG